MSPLLGMFGIGQTELIIVAVIILILFGHRLPSLMFSLGKGVNTFKEGLNAKGEPDDNTTATVTDKNKE
jgi:sec-independent protein translocase protein TatA